MFLVYLYVEVARGTVRRAAIIEVTTTRDRAEPTESSFQLFVRGIRPRQMSRFPEDPGRGDPVHGAGGRIVHLHRALLDHDHDLEDAAAAHAEIAMTKGPKKLITRHHAMRQRKMHQIVRRNPSEKFLKESRLSVSHRRGQTNGNRVP